MTFRELVIKRAEREAKRIVIKPAFPKPATPKKPEVQGGIGSEIRRLLKSMGVADDVKCGCSDIANLWDRIGVDWCIKHKDHLVKHLVNQATERNWLLSVAAKMFAWEVVELAIKNVTTKK